MSSTELDIQQIKRFHGCRGIVCQAGDVEYIEDATNMHRVKKYEYDGNAWQFKEYKGRCELLVISDHITKKPGQQIINVCATPRRGMSAIMKALTKLACLVSNNDNVTALVKIQEVMDSLSVTSIQKKRAPSEFNIFLSKELRHLKETQPDKDSKERFRLAVNAWKTRDQ